MNDLDIVELAARRMQEKISSRPHGFVMQGTLADVFKEFSDEIRKIRRNIDQYNREEGA